MAASNAASGDATGWPDVALAIVNFAREDLWTFIPAVVVLAAAIWLLFPRPTAMLREGYRILRQHERARMAEEHEDD